MVSRYGPVKQEGICILPPPPTHYRMLPPQRTEPFHVPTQQSYVGQQPPAQPGNQGPLRTIGSAGQPNQPTTPPNAAEQLKVQQMPQQTSMGLAYVQQQPQVRGNQNYYRNQAPTNQTQRMANHRQGQQAGVTAAAGTAGPIYPTSTPFVSIPTMPHVYLAPHNMPFYNTAPRQAQYVSQPPPFQVIPAGQHIQYAAYQPQPQGHQAQGPYYFQTMPRAGPTPPMPATGPQNPPPPPAVPAAQQHAVAPSVAQPAPPQLPKQPKRRAHAIPIIDPKTGEDRLLEVFEDGSSSSHPPSGESSARQTPQPPMSACKEVQATFAKQVAQAICGDEVVVDQLPPPHHHHHHHHPPIEDHGVVETLQQPPTVIYPTPQAVNSYDSIVQSSKLQAQTKEFVPANYAPPPQPQVEKEIPRGLESTPVVSALTDAVEVTIANKPPKERESPLRSGAKKQQQQQQQQQHQPPQQSPQQQPPPQQQQLPKEEPPKQKEPPTVATKEAKEAVNVASQKEERRSNQRKEKGGGGEPKAVPVIQELTTVAAVPVESVAAPVSAPQSPVASQESCPAAPGKSKHSAAQRNKDGGKQQPSQHQHHHQQQQQQQSQPQQQQQSQQQQPQQKQQQEQQQPQQQQTTIVSQKPATQQAPVPVPQPAKPSSKTSKMKEINSKGANKEGTDMDAFNDNGVTTTDVVNANVPVRSPSPPVNDNGNINSQVILNTNVQQPPPVTNNKKAENDVTTTTPTPTTKQEPKPSLPIPKSKVDVTSIVRDIPKAPKTFVVREPTPAHDECDNMAILSTEKLVQQKNEANAKSNAEAGNALKGLHLPYREDQWSPINPDGKKVYDIEFLMLLKNDPKSKRKPDNINADVYRAICKSNVSSRTDFTPPFGNAFMGKSSSAHQPPPKRNSQSKMAGGGGGGKGGQKQIRLSISVREDVKLHKTENAWRPARFKTGQDMTEDDKKTEELYRKVRGVLNKLTPQKFDTLINQVRLLNIDTKDRLQGVIDLVFEKAVDEPNFSYGYALMCKHLAQMKVPTSDGKKEDGQDSVNFRKLLITRCQLEFEKNSVDESARNKIVQEIEECADPEKKKELLLNLEEYDRRIRMKSVGNIRFIGELFKQGMLTASIMIRCLYDLIEKKDEERLECLCKLLTTVGKELENKKEDLNPIFSKMREIVDKKHGKISSRIKFMLQDVMDLRRSKWVPRRQDLNPKTIDQIQKEAETEQLNIQAMNAMTPRKEERGGSGPSSDRKNRNRNVSDDGWSTAPSRNSKFTVHSDKLKNRPPSQDEPLGNPTMHCQWSKGATIKNTQYSVPTTTPNMYAALENISADSEKKPSLSSGGRPGSKDPYSSKGPSMERTYKQYNDDGRSSRSGSQHRSNDGSTLSSLRGSPAPVPVPSPAPAVPAAPKAAPAAPVAALDEEQLERRLKNILEEYLNDCCTIEECDQDIKDSLPPSAVARLVSYGYLYILERSKTARLQSGLLFAKLIKLGTLPLQDYCAGLEEVLAQVDDLIIDIPKIWDYLSEILLHPVCTEALPLKTLHKCCELLISQRHAANLLKGLFLLVIAEKGPNFLQNIWQSSGLSLNDFMPGQDVSKFIKDNKFEFLLCDGESRHGETELSYEQIHDKLLQLFTAKAVNDEVFNWISANVGERVKEKQFIRTLATAIFENSIVNKTKLSNETLANHYNLIHRYVDNKPEYELQCLYALQALINKLEHPQGVLLSICSKLYEEGAFSQDCFIAWEESKDPAELEGKGVALKQLTSFFTQLKENDDEDVGSTASDEAEQ